MGVHIYERGLGLSNLKDKTLKGGDSKPPFYLINIPLLSYIMMFKYLQSCFYHFVDALFSRIEDHALSNYEFDETTTICVDTTPCKTLREWIDHVESE